MLRIFAAFLAIALAGCASSSAARRPPANGAGGAASPSESGSSNLPPVPLVEGELSIVVRYPPPDHLIEARDSNFLFGSVGNGNATLTINGTPVEVLPNGAWLAWLPVPSAPVYELVATLGMDTIRDSLSVRLLPVATPMPATGPLVVDSASLVPRTRLALRDSEIVRVGVRAPANATVWLETGSERFPLAHQQGAGAEDRSPSETGTWWASRVPAAMLRDSSHLIAARGEDTIRLTVNPVLPAPNYWGILDKKPGEDTRPDTDRVITARPIPAGTYKWLLIPGTRVQATGISGDFVRVRLDRDLEAWVGADELLESASGAAGSDRIAQNARLQPSPEWVDLIIPMSDPPPYLVNEGSNSLELTLYSTVTNTDIVHYAPSDSFVRLVTSEQITSDRAKYVVELSAPAFGYLVFWRPGELVLRVRRPPRINPDRPLSGLTIAVDAGHPPAGATGPTGLYEAEPVLEISRKLRGMLEARGATVYMTRTTADPLALGDRPVMARRANAHALVSIHLNALPDGVNPYTSQGTGTYFFHPQAAPLARAVQRSMVKRMGLPDRGVFYDNLALARPTWMPSILCEGAFIMMPRQEAALRTSEFQEAYARGVADGIEAYFKGLSSSGDR